MAGVLNAFQVARGFRGSSGLRLQKRGGEEEERQRARVDESRGSPTRRFSQKKEAIKITFRSYRTRGLTEMTGRGEVGWKQSVGWPRKSLHGGERGEAKSMSSPESLLGRVKGSPFGGVLRWCTSWI